MKSIEEVIARDTNQRCEEFQEIMTHFPRKIVFFGIFTVSFVMIGLLATASFIHWTQNIECHSFHVDANNRKIICAIIPKTSLKMIPENATCTLRFSPNDTRMNDSNIDIKCKIHKTTYIADDENYIYVAFQILKDDHNIINISPDGYRMVIIIHKMTFRKYYSL